jgi:hypothetical protein
MEIWKTLTSKQKDVLFSKYGGYASRWFQVKMLSEDYMKTTQEQKQKVMENRRTTSVVSNDKPENLRIDPIFTRKVKH